MNGMGHEEALRCMEQADYFWRQRHAIDNEFDWPQELARDRLEAMLRALEGK